MDTSSPIPLDDFADLIGDYRFPERTDWVRCQLVDQKGKCKRLHGSGWIAQLKNLTEGYIGHMCAEDHFGNDPRYAPLFAAAKARVNREISTDALVARLGGLLSDEKLPLLIEAAMRRQRHVDARITRVRDLLPHKLLKKLDSVKGNELRAAILVFYEEMDEDPVTKTARKVTRSQEYDVGPITGLEGLKRRPNLLIGGKLSVARAALEEAVASIEQPDAAMAKWASQLEYVSRADDEINRHEAAIQSFCRPGNLKLLWLLTRHRVDQLSIAARALEIGAGKPAPEPEAAAALSAWSKEIEAAYGDRRFEVIG